MADPDLVRDILRSLDESIPDGQKRPRFALVGYCPDDGKVELFRGRCPFCCGETAHAVRPLREVGNAVLSATAK